MFPKHYLLAVLVWLSYALPASADVVIDNFNDNIQTSWYSSSSYQLTEENGELKVVANKNAYKVFQKGFARLDMSKHKVVQMRIKVYHNVAPVVRVDLEDANGYVSNAFSTQVVTLPDSQYAVYQFNFAGRFRQMYNSAGQVQSAYLDSTKIVKLTFHLNAPGNYAGTIFLDDIIVPGAQPLEVFGPKSTWKYFTGAAAPLDWTTTGFDDTGWESDTAEFGYGDGDETTSIPFGIDADQKFVTTWFRKTFEIYDKDIMKALVLETKSDDGAVVYLNGFEIGRVNMPAGNVTETTLALSELTEASENKWNRFVFDSSTILYGSNVIAVEVHLSSPSSEDLSFDARFSISRYKPGIVRGPYIQSTGSQSTVIRWRSLENTEGRVIYGTDLNNMNTQVDSATGTTEHILKISGLNPATKYFYAICRQDGDTLVGADSSFYFTTHPLPGTDVPLRAWITGDAGKENKDQRDVRDAFYLASGKKATDLWLLLGDNAYNEGTDDEYQFAMFQDMFEEQMKHTTLFPTPGNHDLRTYINSLEQAPYYQIFSMPQEGESGGFPSGSKAYYSFDFGNTHFISLDSYGTPRDSTQAMATWLKADLAASQARWTVAFWHHPPYTKGSHDSDNPTNSNDNNPGGKSRLFEMREQIVPLLEKAGVDLVLCGHSHVYERSYMLHGHYGTSNTFNDEPHLVNGVISGKKSLGEQYVKNPVDANYPDIGTVYAVVGCSGLKSQSVAGWPLSQIMYFSSANHTGSMILEVNHDTLTAKFLSSTGIYPDEFSIVKDATHQVNLVTSRQYGISESKTPLLVYPNPSREKISLDYSAPSKGYLQIELYDVHGKQIKKILNEEVVPGNYHQEIIRGSIVNGFYKVIMKLNGKIVAEQGLVLE